jgi:hypothetical protein
VRSVAAFDVEELKPAVPMWADVPHDVVPIKPVHPDWWVTCDLRAHRENRRP